MQQRSESSAAVVAAQTVERVPLERGGVGVARPTLHGLDGVDMGVEQQGGAPLVILRVSGPEVVALARIFNSASPQFRLHDICRPALGAAHRRSGYQAHEQRHRVISIFFCGHRVVYLHLG